ncbi:Os05g0302075 [Oryza sativa Japonica Group]|uniref:Os05g0302075 protein n=2 Tax=Oryza TaxID=4527 RepID=A0A0N7KKH5_ORYSJ|nr:Os05g0302075 [Oryza sativa Japonica Group]
MMHQQLFYPATPPPTQKVGEFWQKFKQAAGTMMDSMGLPFSSINFRASALNVNNQSKMDCFPLASREVICTDQSGRAFLVNADTCEVGTMPSLHKPKSMPLSVFVVRSHDGYGSSLFVMERIPKPELGFNSDQFEAFVYRKSTLSSYRKAWHCH